MHSELFQPIDAQTRRGSVVNLIRQAILEGGLLPGEQVNQAQIAEKLGISRGPVREALGQLEEEGLIRNVPYKGTFVTEITPEYIEELYSIRRLIEGFAIRRVIEVAQPEEIAALRDTVEQMREAAAVEDAALLGTLDIHFHYLLCGSAHHTLLMQIWKSIEIGVRRCLTLRHRKYADPRDIVGSHPDILAAIEAGDADQASALLDAHIQEAGELLHRSWSEALAAAEAEEQAKEEG